MRVLSARSPCYTVIYKGKAFGGNPPKRSKLLVPLTVATWFQISWTLVSKLASTDIFCPSINLTWIVVTGLFRLGSSIKFSCGPFFLANLGWGLLASDRDVPAPENAMYGGGGGGTYFSFVLSDRLTESPPFGYFYRNFFGIFPSLSYFMNCLLFGSLKSMKSPSSIWNPFSYKVILQTLPSFSFYYLAKS